MNVGNCTSFATGKHSSELARVGHWLTYFCQFCRSALTATGLTVAIPCPTSSRRYAQRNGRRRRPSRRKRLTSTCFPLLASHASGSRLSPVHPLFREITESLSVFPGLKACAVDTGISSMLARTWVAPGARRSVPDYERPELWIRTSSPLAKASPIISNTRLTASLAAALLIAVRPVEPSASSGLFIRALPFSRSPLAFRIE